MTVDRNHEAPPSPDVDPATLTIDQMRAAAAQAARVETERLASMRRRRDDLNRQIAEQVEVAKEAERVDRALNPKPKADAG